MKIKLIACWSLNVLFFLISLQLIAQNIEKKFDVPLNDVSQITIDGPYRFVKIAGIEGLLVKSLNTKAYVENSLLNEEKGTVSVWMSPMEDIDKFPAVPSGADIYNFPLLSDHFPSRQSDSCSFSFYYSGSGYPRIIGRFTSGKFWNKMDYGLAPFVYAEDLKLQKGQWYNLVLTWDKLAATLKMYINGELVGHNFSAKEFNIADNKLYLGNPLMVVSHLMIQSEILDINQVREIYHLIRPATNSISEKTIHEIVTPQNKPQLDIIRDNSWKKTYECSFTNPAEVKQWTLQTGDLYRDKLKLETDPDGLLFQTPDIIHTESRGNLWCPVNVEGDQWIEYEFKLVSPKGLALVIICASGFQGEDVIDNHGLTKTGSMSDMLANYRNYHWEYVRRVEAMRTDVETQYVNKNPWGKSLYVGCIPRLEQNKWYKMRLIKKGNRLYGSIDGNTVFDVEDDPYNNNGPCLNSGRVVLRQMYNTAMKYRNFVIYSKESN